MMYATEEELEEMRNEVTEVIDDVLITALGTKEEDDD